ncbi:MAG: membrane protein insertase YidC [Ghiorsea sp.]
MESKNLILAFALSMGVLMGWGWIFPPQQTVVSQDANTEQTQTVNDSTETNTNTTNTTSPSSSPTQVSSASKEVFESHTIQTFGNDVISLSINAKGWLSDAKLTSYQLSLEDPTKVQMLTTGEFHEAYINSGVVGKKLVSPFKQVSLVEKNDTTVATFEGTLDGDIVWQRVYTLTQGSYLINVKDRLVGGAGYKLYRQVVEKNPIESATANYNEHIGPIGLFQDKLTEVSYDDLNETGPQKLAAMGGWTGMMSRYFISAIYGADQSESYRYYYKGDGRSYQSGMINDGVVDQGDMIFDNNMFIGPKAVPLLKETGVGLERSVDFGWFTVIAEPLHDVMLWMHQYISNFGVIIILMVITIKLILFIPTQSAYRSMASMRKLQPEMARLKDRYGDDRAKMGQEVMGLYKKNQVNPLGGCLPILMQMPIFFALYKVLLISIELRQSPFYGWIEDMSVQDPFFILPLLMGISMYVQMQLNPQPTDQIQAAVMKFLPVMMTVLFLFFPAGLVLYWVVNNILSIIQQRMVMKSMNVD